VKRTPLVAVFLTVVIDLLGFGIVLPLLPQYADDHGASPLMRGLLFASFSAMQFLFAPLWGRLSDRIGRRPVLMAGLAGSVGSYALFAVAEATPWPLALLMVSRLTAGVAGATISTASAYIADVTTPQERGRGMALIGAAFGVGFTIGPMIGGLSFSLSPYAPGAIAATLSLAAFLFAWKNLPEPARRTAGRRALLDVSALRTALRTPTVPRILLLAFLATAAFAMYESTLALLARREFGMNQRQTGWVFAWIGFCLVLAQGLLVRRLMPRLGEVRLAQAGTLLLGGGLLALALVTSVGALYAVVPITVAGFAFLTPSLSSLISQRTLATTQGEVLGLHQSGLSLARIVGPLGGNLLQGASLDLPYYVGTAALLAAFLLALGLGGRGMAGSVTNEGATP
jgi:MFS transporter, DHA1 family, tetracycline resistance protein